MVGAKTKKPNFLIEEEEGEDCGQQNRSGIFSVNVKLDRDIPNLLPMSGKRIKITYILVKLLVFCVPL